MGFLSNGIETGNGGGGPKYYEAMTRRAIPLRAVEPIIFTQAKALGVNFVIKDGVSKDGKPYSQERWTVAMQVSPTEFVDWTIFGAFIRENGRGPNPGHLWDLLALAVHQREGADEPTGTHGDRTFLDNIQGLRFDIAVTAVGYKANTMGEMVTYLDGRVFEAGTGRTATEVTGVTSGRPDREGTLGELRRKHAEFIQRSGGLLPNEQAAVFQNPPQQATAPRPAPQAQPAADDDLPF